MDIKTPPERLYFIDNLRVRIIILVVAHHAGQTFGPTGGFWVVYDTERIGMLGPFFYVNASFFMGLLFFISGYFSACSCDRKGAVRFLRTRLRRIGIPLLFFALAVNLPVSHSATGVQLTFFQYVTSPHLWVWRLLYSHLWFLGHLIVYACGYTTIRLLFSHDSTNNAVRGGVPRHRSIMIYVISLGIVSSIVRIWFPQDRWVVLLVPWEFAHLVIGLQKAVIGLSMPTFAKFVFVTVFGVLISFSISHFIKMLSYQVLKTRQNRKSHTTSPLP
jgi:glucan biosynthesis protein C